jgi:uncharacterized protein (DUF2141 family)
MKKIIALLLSIGSTTFAANLTVTIDNIQSNKGNIRLAVFAEADKVRFPSGTPTMIINQSTGESTKGIVEPATEGAITFRITAPVGVYAISAYHDKNNNKELDKSFFGVPSEPYGFSNDARGIFGPPDYFDAQFDLKDSGAKIVFDVM